MTAPVRVQLRRAKGWSIPDNTVVVSRTSKWGNPFIVGTTGTQAECVNLYTLMLGGYFAVGRGPTIPEQRLAFSYVSNNIRKIRGKNLACWCRPGSACHGDVLLKLANARVCDEIS